MADRQIPVLPPQPAFCSLDAAVKAAIAHGNHLHDIRPDRWAATYGCGVEDIRIAWDAALSEASLHPNNSYDVEGK